MMMTLSRKLSMNMMKHSNGVYVFFRFMFQQKSTLVVVKCFFPKLLLLLPRLLLSDIVSMES